MRPPITQAHCAASPLMRAGHDTRVPFEAASAMPALVTIWVPVQLNVGSGVRCLAAAPGSPASFAWRRRFPHAFTASRSRRVGPTNPQLVELRCCFRRFADGLFVRLCRLHPTGNRIKMRPTVKSARPDSHSSSAAITAGTVA